ncbi:conserved hypothetical protein [Neospora caninum Liverpool]|nr:conserved hypothetical protein [Neospora caninum Liverpool]CBZ52307.1 conserved hypothetical protein [Neospora caninum Liverpool]|eukprot:XP_003882339.1 conserved hypothetical protein [Neospora caninum Liverpool]
MSVALPPPRRSLRPRVAFRTSLALLAVATACLFSCAALASSEVDSDRSQAPPRRLEAGPESLQPLQEANAESLQLLQEANTESLQPPQETNTDSLQPLQETNTESPKRRLKMRQEVSFSTTLRPAGSSRTPTGGETKESTAGFAKRRGGTEEPKKEPRPAAKDERKAVEAPLEKPPRRNPEEAGRDDAELEKRRKAEAEPQPAESLKVRLDHVRIEDIDGPESRMSRDYVPRPSNPFYGHHSLGTKGKHLVYPSGLPYVYEAVATHSPSPSPASLSLSEPGACAFFLYVHPLYPTYTNSGDPTRVPGPNGGAYESASTLWYWQLRELRRRGEHDVAVLFFPHFHPRMLSVGSLAHARKTRGNRRTSEAQGIRQHAGWLASQTRTVLELLLGEASREDGGAQPPAAADGESGDARETRTGEQIGSAGDDGASLLRAAGLLDLQQKCRRWDVFFLGWGTGGLSLRAMLSLGAAMWVNKEGWFEEVTKLHALFEAVGVQASAETEATEQVEVDASGKRGVVVPEAGASSRKTRSSHRGQTQAGEERDAPASSGRSADWDSRRGTSESNAAELDSEEATEGAIAGAQPGAPAASVHLRTVSFLGVPHAGVGSQSGKNRGIEKLGWTKWLMGLVPESLMRRFGNTTYRRELLHVDPDRVLCSLAQEEKQNYSFPAREGSLLSAFETVLFYGFLNTEYDFPTLSQLGVSEALLLTSEAVDLLQSNPEAQSRFFYMNPLQTSLNKIDIMASTRFAPLVQDRSTCSSLSLRKVYSFVLKVLEVVNRYQTPKSVVPRRYIALKGRNFYDTPDDASSWTHLFHEKEKHENAAASRYIYIHQAVRMMQSAEAQELPFDDDHHEQISGAWFYRRA